MNTDQNNADDNGTDNLKFHIPEDQKPGEGLGNGDTGMRDFNPAEPGTKDSPGADKAAWNEATGDGEKSEQVSTRDQDNSTV